MFNTYIQVLLNQADLNNIAENVNNVENAYSIFDDFLLRKSLYK